jgi:glycosyltransferase involved in cell wall biosynthesis
MTRVLFIEPAGDLWGSEKALLDLIRWLPGLEIGVCCPPDRPIIPKLKELSVKVFPYFAYALHKKSRWARTGAAVGVARACLEFRPDVIHLNQAGCYKVVLPAATLFNVPIVAHVRIFEDADYLAARAPDPRRLRAVLAISSAVEKAVRKNPQLDQIPVHVLYDAYVADQSIDKPMAQVDRRIACVGRLVPIKGQDLLIAAMHRLFESDKLGAECLIVGDGPPDYVQALKDAAMQGAAGSAIALLGFRSDVVPILRSCAVLVCPSHREPLGRVILEAWDAGAIPVACALSGGAAEVIGASEGGILYSEQTPESLASALRTALRLPGEEAAALIRNGRSWMEKHCHPRCYGEAFANLLVLACESSS